METASQQYELQWPIQLYKLMIGAVVVACLALTFVVARNEREVLLVILGTMCLVVVSIPIFIRKQVSVFEPILLVNLLVLIGIPVKLIYILWVRESEDFIANIVLLRQQPEVFLNGTFVLLIGYSMFALGYMVRFPKVPFSPIFMPQVTQWNGRRLQLTFLILGSISVLSFFAYVVVAGVSFSSFTDMSQKRFLEARAEGAERIHNVGYFFCRGAALSKFLVYFCLIWIVHRRKSFCSWTGLLMVFAALQTMLIAVSLNSRAGVALLLLDCAVLAYYLYGRLSLKLVVAFLAVALALMLPMMVARELAVDNRKGRDAREFSLERILQKTFCNRNMLDISKCCHIINGVPEKMDYRKGEMFYAWLAAPIPASYWPEKPMWTGQGVYVNQRIFGYRGSHSGCPASLIGELHWNFGISGIWFGLFFAGLLFRQIFLSFYPHRSNPTSILIYTMIATRFIIFSMGNDLGTGIVKAGLDLVPVYAVLMFVGMVPVDRKVTMGNVLANNGIPVLQGAREYSK